MQSLGIGIIIPQFIAGQDRWWAPHKGRLPGARTPLPYRAPIDHILDLERGIGRTKDENEFGPNVPFREYSFLDNPRMPARIRESVLTVELCQQGEVGCADRVGPAEVRNGTVRLQPGLNDKQLRVALSDAAARYKVLKFRTMTSSLVAHEGRREREQFDRRIRMLASIWCCVHPAPGKPGHVWYDMWWDTVPHTDLHNRVWTEPWHIVTGP
jgi:arabinosyltransferase